jgi:hypothetical protein
MDPDLCRPAGSEGADFQGMSRHAPIICLRNKPSFMASSVSLLSVESAVPFLPLGFIEKGVET